MKHLKTFEGMNNWHNRISGDWKKILSYLDSINYSDYVVGVADSYGWEDEERWGENENEDEWFSAFSHFAEDDIIQEILDQVKMEFKDIDVDKYEDKIRDKVKENV